MNTYSVKQLQERYGVGEHTVLGWIKSGELRAINTRRSGSNRPKWRFTEEAVSQFELIRSTSPPQPKSRRRQPASTTIQFYK
ncbi:MAG TPA: helix-turn-helix domain-containing protein [Planctomycetaceae bacterium]|nr:helix-turn-helix domain-containing protein [Planctomycetaceae bacterium]